MASLPSHVVSWELFQHNQLPYLELRRPFILGTMEAEWRPTVAHFFMRVCADKGLLRRVYTQNIDGLDQVWGTIVPHLGGGTACFGFDQIGDEGVFCFRALCFGFLTVCHSEFVRLRSLSGLIVLFARCS